MKISNVVTYCMILAILFSVVACKQKDENKTAAESEKPSRVLDVSEVTTIMTVKEIDLPSRLFTLDYGEGNEIVVEAAEDLTGIDKIKVGDEVSVTYLTSTAVYVTSPDSERKAVQQSRTVEIDTESGKPRKITVDIIEKTSTVEAIDIENRMVTLKDHEGKVKTIEVSDEVRNLENVKVGDQVVFQYTETVAVDISKVEE